jgi:hypothetical protein
VKATLVLVLLLALAPPLQAAPGEITITSFIRITDNIGEVRGKVALNEDKGALVTVTNGAASYSTVTDDRGGWSVLLALRSNRVEATVRGLDGSASRAVADAALDAAQPPFGPAPAELYSLTRGILSGETPVTGATVARLTALMDQSIMHAGGWEFDNRMVLLMLGCTGRIVQTMSTASASEQQALDAHLAALGKLLYKGVVRGMDGNPPGGAGR